ncbi:carbohydrate ABC transporter permease [Dyella nitratireducens]|uniref:sn-glycerol-3-phosphate transport system permease protein UgpA n=1 Tax=Dyella nitratireducens TaxID=1849580 RepID=A0ABQ1GA30_9GAMM|nr:sugar ABC transporter permease [Dyella nitratireducens]GGA39675.1 glycerol-3-phosphate transporter permease [Dyella nitratireducens]GLQ40471.1 glycerol-3-phosphate transporter permease [Dyella nitratireducens]
MKTSARFHGRWTPFALGLPQLALIALFFYWPTLKGLWWSFHLVCPFGHCSSFVGFDNYLRELKDANFYASLFSTAVFSLFGVGASVIVALVLAWMVELHQRSGRLFRYLLIWPYAVAGSVLGVILRVASSPSIGLMGYLNSVWPGFWQPHLNGTQAMTMVVFAFAWTQIPFDFIVLVAALRSIPADYMAAAAIDGAGPLRRFIDIQIPMIRPQLFFVATMNLIDSITNSFAIVDTMTQGGPGGATNILAYKIYRDGFIGLDLSGSSALSILLMLLVLAASAVQFVVFERQAKREA